MIDVILLTGFLGSGKTTFLNEMLPVLARRYRRVAVVMNEFGSVGVDGRLVDGQAASLWSCKRIDFLYLYQGYWRPWKSSPDPKLMAVIEATALLIL